MIGDNCELQGARARRPRVVRGARPRGPLVLGVAALLLALAAGGCSILGGDTPARTWYELTDLHAAAASAASASARAAPTAPVAPTATGNPLVLLISPVSENSFYDGTAIAFSRQSGARAYYQYAAWTERPVKRLAQLLEHRLVAERAFVTVAQATAGISGDLLLNLRLEEIYLDAAQPPGSARIVVTAELLDWRARKVIARQRFERSAMVDGEDPSRAAAGFDRAVTELLDELTAWLATSSAGVH